MLTKKELKRFINDVKVPIQPIPDQDYLNHVFSLLPELKPKYDIYCEEVANTLDFLEMWDKWKAKIIEDLKDRQTYKDFIAYDMSRWAPVNLPKGGFPTKDVFEKGNEGKCFLSIDLRKANFQALKKAGIHTEETWEEFIGKYTDSVHIKTSKQFRSIIYGNLNISRTQTVERYLINEVRRTLGSLNILPENYVLWSMMPDELIYEIKDGEPDLEYLHDIDSFIKGVTDVSVKIQQFRLIRRVITPSGGGKDIEFFEKEDLYDYSRTIHCLGTPYYLIGISLLKGLTPDYWDYVFLNQEGFRCKIEEKFTIN